MLSKEIIVIDEDLCIGCGLCVNACLESAIQIVDGVAKLVKEDHCDGLGNCLPECPTDAISLVERKVSPTTSKEETMACGCPSDLAQAIEKTPKEDNLETKSHVASQLNQWPVQLKLVSETAGYFQGADLLIAADCTAYAYGNFHEDFIKNKITLIACPKLDGTDYTGKIANILKFNNIKSLTLVKMQVPCCSGLARMVDLALDSSGSNIPVDYVTLSASGEII